MQKPTTSWVATVVATCLIHFVASAQGDLFLGSPVQPSPTDSVASLSFHGDYMDMSGGYQIGDTVADFQIYDLEGNGFRLSDHYAGNKYIVLSSVSASCVRFVTSFNVEPGANNHWEAYDFMVETQDELEWVFIYGPEAHPGDLENCTSNCPPVTITAPNGDTLFQHQIYQDRIDAASLWMDITQEDTLTFDWQWPLYLDNPQNEVYDHFFERPFGCLVVDCSGVVVWRGDWTAQYLESEGMQILEELMADGFQQCGYPPICDGLDSDGDGYCDDYEIEEGMDPFDACVPNGEDTDGDGYCDVSEILEGWDPENPCDPDNTDSDNDGTCDQQEIIDGTDPFVNENVVNVSEFTSVQFSVYPNPTDGLLTWEAADEIAFVEINDLTGKLVFEGVPNNRTLDISMLPAGAYVMHLRGMDGQYHICRMARK
ncbi:MAG: T9SS type A sorting domain-containing protein [Flavobacteriales bacterium]|nr:T9SS type A sorting domain-containing protein [Flavobacteriales bacterium]